MIAKVVGLTWFNWCLIKIINTVSSATEENMSG